ncbi:MAG: alpha/beta hydrolase [Spirochaetia bacterium]|nr:alpha/beta hydrolase [Spirochaetia bacterium]
MREKNLPGIAYLSLITLPSVLLFSLALILFSLLIFTYLITVIVLFPVFYSVIYFLYSSRTDEDEIHYAKTNDGWNLALHRYKPNLPSKHYPVIFLHGIFVNRYSVDLDREHSMAAYLQRLGYDVFVPDLRAKGKSFFQNKKAPEYSFDDLAREDGPSIIKAVKILTGEKKVHWIGHSMGGMIGYSAAANPVCAKSIQSLVTVSAPGKSDFIRNGPWYSFIRYKFFVKFFNLKILAKLAIPFTGIADLPPENFIYSRENLSANTMRKLKMNAVENTSPLMLTQLASWIKTGKEISLDGKYNYAETFKKIKCPSLFLGGMKDQIANPAGVVHAYQDCGSRNKKLILYGKNHNGKSDFCHMGMIMGRKAPDEVFPEILKWLNQHDKKGKTK